jgi:hypothetical protein
MITKKVYNIDLLDNIIRIYDCKLKFTTFNITAFSTMTCIIKPFTVVINSVMY